MPQSSFTPIFLDHPSPSELEAAILGFEQNLSTGKLHITARKGLNGRNELAFTEPFPKIESHDTYLYGVFATFCVSLITGAIDKISNFNRRIR